MTFDDQIKNEKIQYNINREAPKISALSSGKIAKYEYLTSEEILPSNQKQIIEHAKFTYSPLGKVLKNKQTRIIKDQGKDQIDALKTLKPKELEAIKDDKSDNNEDFLKYKEIFDELSNERIGEIHNIAKQIDFDNLTYHLKEETLSPINFIKFRGPII